MCQRCCLLISSGAHPGRESLDLFPLELSQILHGMHKGLDPCIENIHQKYTQKG